jgi:transcriptional regulator with XRE-family HTH domain
MATGKRRFHPINKEEVLRLQRSMGLTVFDLAERAGLDWKTLNKWLNGEVEGGLISKVTKLAKALGVSPDRIIDAPGKALYTTVEAEESHTFEMTIKLKGTLSDPRKAIALTHATENLLNDLSNKEVALSGHESQVAIFTSKDGELKRMIVLIYGLLENGNPFWVFAAVRPDMYPLFKVTQKAGRIDLQNFELFGEIIVSGEGNAPPDDVTIQVAEIYQTDAKTLIAAIES